MVFFNPEHSTPALFLERWGLYPIAAGPLSIPRVFTPSIRPHPEGTLAVMNKRSPSVDYSKPNDFQEFKRRFLAGQGRSREGSGRALRVRRDRSDG